MVASLVSLALVLLGILGLVAIGQNVFFMRRRMPKNFHPKAHMMLARNILVSMSYFVAAIVVTVIWG